jgi:hypothetical protein
MGGPWRDRRLDPHDVAHTDRARSAGAHRDIRDVPDPLTGIVVGYIAAALTSLGMLPALLRNGW